MDILHQCEAGVFGEKPVPVPCMPSLSKAMSVITHVKGSRPRGGPWRREVNSHRFVRAGTGQEHAMAKATRRLLACSLLGLATRPTGAGNPSSIGYQIHSNNDLGAWTSLLQKVGR